MAGEENYQVIEIITDDGPVFIASPQLMREVAQQVFDEYKEKVRGFRLDYFRGPMESRPIEILSAKDIPVSEEPAEKPPKLERHDETLWIGIHRKVIDEFLAELDRREKGKYWPRATKFSTAEHAVLREGYGRAARLLREMIGIEKQEDTENGIEQTADDGASEN